MNVTIPLYVEERRPAGAPVPHFYVRPLFFDSPQRHADQLGRSMSKLAQDLRRQLDRNAHAAHHGDFAAWTFNPETEEHHVKFDLVLKRHTGKVRLLFVSFEALDRRLAFSPSLPDLWFEVARGDRVADRAKEVYTEHFLKVEREDKEHFHLPPELIETHRACLSQIELDVYPVPEVKKKAESLPFFLLGGPPVGSGREELEKVGRCLDWLYPDELDRAVLSDAEVNELARRLADPDRRPVLVSGPRQSGKTAIVHESVYRRVAQRKSPHASRRNVWLLSPQRLISGMMYVGQWEARLLAILDEAKKSEHILYFDDLLGLYHAGVHSMSDLSVADVLRPYVERREVRVLAEITPEALRVLRERDRPMADLFHVLPVREATESQTRRILVSAMRQYEDRYRCTFDLEALPAVLDLQQRYVHDTALPGKAAGFLRQLAVKQRPSDAERVVNQVFGGPAGGTITRQTVLDEFHAKSGLSLSFLDGAQKLERAEVVKSLAARVVGQRQAVETMADAVVLAKARLNDPGRPLSCFLFLGPTGVGKTESAKALARYLFGGGESGSAAGAGGDRLLRFDMNEFVEPDSAARLVGTFHKPEGLLTSAVRREPFCVVLLDEIEKAHPAVFDLLLAVLGEGRLTDARGRTADFTNAVVIMTSNLGVREAANTFGLRPGGEGTDDAATYLAAAERFFRPEFFNRIDRVIPFARLTREEVGRIATLLMEDVFRREGLVHRRSILTVDPAAMAKVVDAGYHPQLGARALKRAIERQLTQPVAARLATMTPGTPAVIGLYPSRDGIAVHVDALDQVATAAAPSARLPMDDPDLVLDCVEDAVVRIEESAAALDPGRGAALTQGALSADHFRYLAVRDQARRVATLVERVDAALDRKASSSNAQRTRYTPGRAPRYKRLTRYDSVGKYLWRHLLSQESLHSHLSDVVGAEVEADHAPGGNEEIADRLCELVGEVALLEAMAAGGADRVLVCVRFLAGIQSVEAAMLQSSYENMFRARYGVSATWLHRQHLGDDLVAPGVAWMLLEMPAAERVLAGEVGTHLFVPAHENVMPAQVSVVPLSEGQDPPSAVREFLGRRERFRAEMVAGRASPADDPWRLGPVVRVYDPAATVDLRTGLASKGWPEAHEFRRFVLAQLPLPAELTEVLSPLPPREG